MSSDSVQETPPKRLSRRRKLLLVVSLLAAVTFAVFTGSWIWLESNAGQERVRRMLEERVSAAVGRDVAIGALAFDLLPLRATLSDITVAGDPGADRPLLQVATARTRLDPWALLSRRVSIEALEIEGPILHWDVPDEGITPLSTGAGDEAGFTVAIERLDVTGGALELNHRRWNIDTGTRSIDATMQSLGSGSTARRTGVVRIGGGSLRLEDPEQPSAAVRLLDPLEAELRFTASGDALDIEELRLRLADSELTASGEIVDWRQARLQAGGRVAITDVAALAGLEISDNDAGTLDLTGSVTLNEDGVDFTGTAGAESVVIFGVPAANFSATIAADLSTIEISDARATLFDGDVEARVTIDRTSTPTRFAVDYSVAGIRLAPLTRARTLPGLRFAGTGGAAGSLTWTTPWRETISGGGNLELDVPAATLGSERPAAADSTRLPTLSAATRAPAATPTAGRQAPPPPAGGASEASPTPSLPLQLRARADYELEAGTLRIGQASASLPRSTATLSGTLDLNGSIATAVAIETSDLRFVDRLFNQIRRFRGEQPVPQPLGLAGRGRVNATVAGTVSTPQLEGTLTATGLSVADNPVGDLEGNLRLAGTSLEVIALTVVRGDGSAEGSGRFRIGERGAEPVDYSFGLRLNAYPMEARLPQLGVPLTVAGLTSGELSWSGDYGSPPIGSGEITGDAVRLNDLTGMTADISVRLDETSWSAERFELLGPLGRLSISGAWERRDDSLQASLDGFGLDAAIASAVLGRDFPAQGSLDVQARLSGDFATPDAAATIRWTDAVAYDVPIGSVALSTELRGRNIAVAAVGRADPDAPAIPPPTPTAGGGDQAVPLPRVPESGWAATLSTELQAPRLASLRASGESGLILAILAAQGYETDEAMDIDGRLDVEGSGSLDDWTSWTGNAMLDEFTLVRPGLTFSIPDPFTLALDGEILRARLPRLISGAGTLSADAVVDLATRRWIEAQANGSISLDVLDVFTRETRVGGRIDVALSAAGDLLSGDVDGAFDLYDVSVQQDKSPWSAEAIRGTVRLADGLLRVDALSGMSEGRPFLVDGVVPLAALAGDTTVEPVRLEVSVDALPLQPLWEKAGPLQQLLRDGTASLTLSAQGRGTDWRTYTGSIDVRALDLQFADVRLNLAQPVAFAMSGGRLELAEPLNLRGPGTNVLLDGFFALAPFRFDARLRGDANLDPLNRITGAWGVAGRAELDMRVVGDPPELAYFGTVNVTNGLLNAPILQPLESITATLEFDNTSVRVRQLVGSLGGGGPRGGSNFSGDGEIQLVDNRPYRFSLNASVDEAELRLEPGVRVTLTADLLHEGTIDGSVLSGTAFVSSGRYAKRWEGEADLLNLASSGGQGVEHALATTVSLDIDVRAPSELRIANNMANVELAADLQVRGTLAAPVLLGRATVLDGTVSMRDHRYRLLHGAVEFQNPLQTEINLDFRAETAIRQYLVTVGITGSPDRGDLQASFSSSPPLSDLQLIQLLTVGTAPDEARLPDSDTIGAVGAQATAFLTEQYLSQVERGAQRVFGVDRFRVEPAITEGSGDPTARVTLGKQVTPELWISWTSVLGTTEEQLVTIEYQLTRGIRLTATREEDGSFGVDVRFDHRFR